MTSTPSAKLHRVVGEHLGRIPRARRGSGVHGRPRSRGSGSAAGLRSWSHPVEGAAVMEGRRPGRKKPILGRQSPARTCLPGHVDWRQGLGASGSSAPRTGIQDSSRIARCLKPPYCARAKPRGGPGPVRSTRTRALRVALAEALVALALDNLEEDRADHVLGEDLQQQTLPPRAARRRPGPVGAQPLRGSRRGPADARRRLRSRISRRILELHPRLAVASTVPKMSSVEEAQWCWMPLAAVVFQETPRSANACASRLSFDAGCGFCRPGSVMARDLAGPICGLRPSKVRTAVKNAAGARRAAVQ